MSSYLVMCGEDGEAGKAVAVRLRKEGHRAVLADAGVFKGRADPCDAVVVMPDVPAWKRDRIEAAYPGKVERTDAAPAQSPAIGLSIKHRGGGRWFVMRGEVIVSGPHSKDEAQRLAG